MARDKETYNEKMLRQANIKQPYKNTQAGQNLGRAPGIIAWGKAPAAKAEQARIDAATRAAQKKRGKKLVADTRAAARKQAAAARREQRAMSRAEHKADQESKRLLAQQKKAHREGIAAAQKGVAKSRQNLKAASAALRSAKTPQAKRVASKAVKQAKTTKTKAIKNVNQARKKK